VRGGEKELFQWLRAPGMNPPRPAVAGGAVGTIARDWLAAAVRPLKKNPFCNSEGGAGGASGGKGELSQWLWALDMNHLPPVVTGGPVGIAVRGWMTAVLHLKKIPCWEGWQGGRACRGAVPMAECARHDLSEAFPGRWAGQHRRSVLVGVSFPPFA